STPHAFREAGSELVYGSPVPGFTLGVQKFAALESSVSFPPTTQWFVMLRRCIEVVERVV
ncbi:MAG TPA: hypothetical protein VI122_00240, partial [Thermoleophilaceae bacterium]